MSTAHLQIDEQTFLRQFEQHSPQLMWFLGAGSSRSSGLPAAIDLIWDLKRRYYCAKENQDLQGHNITNPAIKEKIQGYFASIDCPEQCSPEEYSYYFELMFGEDYHAQQSYIQDQMSPDKVTLTIGPRALASLLALSRTRVVFTTNFDDVIENAYATVSGQNVSPFHLEGSYAALDALNAEKFPLYAKIHGDFRYRKIKNISTDLRSNDAEIQKCFVSAAGRYGLVVAGYSGRDGNVMSMLKHSLEQPNPLPLGLWWAVPRTRSAASPVVNFIQAARDKGVRAHIVEIGTFDVMMYKIWRQIPDKPQALDDKVRSAPPQSVSIPFSSPGTGYPILRTNALQIIEAPAYCGAMAARGVTAADVFAVTKEKRPSAVVSYQDGVIFWGESTHVAQSLEGIVQNEVAARDLGDPVAQVARSSYLKSFFEHGLAKALCRDKPLLLRKMGRIHYAVVFSRQANDTLFAPLKRALGSLDTPIGGAVPGLPDTFWNEAVRLKLEERANVLWLMLEPEIWIRPLKQREFAREFLRTRKLRRYNNQSSSILNAWIEILLGPAGQGASVTVTFAPESTYPAAFTISTRTAFSRRGTA